jgi:GNAT superfamily N-acetyltransferase
MHNIEDEIRNNLYEFYDQISQIGGIYSEKQDHWSVVSNIPGVWPSLIYRIDSEIVGQQSSTIFSEKVKSGSYPELLITSEGNIQQIDPFLREKGFYPFAAWKGMAIESMTDDTPTLLPETIRIVKPESSEEMEQWLKIVNLELIAPAQIDKMLLENLIARPEFEAFLLKYNGVGVSTILIFNSGNSTGLYLIATEKSAQRQGFARLLVQQILRQKAQESKNPVILHATQKGENLYSKLGFLPFSQFFLYRYLNTNL